jgi:hypothetical protein
VRISPKFLKAPDIVGNLKIVPLTYLTASLFVALGTESIEEYHFMYTPDIKVHLIDTPGFDDSHRSDREILLQLVDWMSQSHGPMTQVSGIIYFHKISVRWRYDEGVGY